MIYIEQNNHTGESRQHTCESLLARMAAIGFPPDFIQAFLNEHGGVIESRHATFRQATTSNRIYPWALPTGAWGKVELRELTPAPPSEFCSLCQRQTTKCICRCMTCNALWRTHAAECKELN